METWFWDKQAYHLGHSKLSHKWPTQGDTVAGVPVGKTTSGEFLKLPEHSPSMKG